MPTIGVAVAIPEPWASELQDFRTAVGDVSAAKIPTHITLIPPTEVGDVDIESIEEHLAAVADRIEGFGVHLRGTGTFRPISPVVFIALAKGISQIEQLADEVRQGPLDISLAFPFHPHVTIAHHLSDDQLDVAFEGLSDFDCEFDVDAFKLYVHDDESGWRPTRLFDLQAGI